MTAPIVERLRERYPLEGVGPVTRKQREDIHEAADLIEKLVEAGGEVLRLIETTDLNPCSEEAEAATEALRQAISLTKT